MIAEFREDARYGFAVGRIRALETTLIDRPRYERLARAASYAEFQAGLAETFYARYAGEGAEGDAVDAVLASAASDNVAFFRKYCLDEWVYRAFRLRDDINNLKVVLKERMAGQEHEPARFVADGLWSERQISALASGDPKSGPAEVRDALADAGWAEGRELDPMELDIALDRLVQRLCLEWAAPSSFLSGYFGLHADVENVRTFVRAKAFGDPRQVLERALLPGGRVSTAELAQLMDEEWDAFAARFRLTPFSRLAEEAARGVAEGTARVLERMGREMELRYLLGARYATFGFEPLVSYYLFRQNEQANLRQLAAAKRAGLEEDVCRELVAYAG